MQKQIIAWKNEDVISCLGCSAKNPSGGDAIFLGHGTYHTKCTFCNKSIKVTFNKLLKQLRAAWQEARNVSSPQAYS